MPVLFMCVFGLIGLTFGALGALVYLAGRIDVVEDLVRRLGVVTIILCGSIFVFVGGHTANDIVLAFAIGILSGGVTTTLLLLT